MNNISKKAKIGKNVVIGYCSKIADNVVIENNVIIGDYCLIGFSIKKKKS
jgi:UDP-3-O-[3-hydroxymyristoyl] glucosamine N-acyltransferase